MKLIELYLFQLQKENMTEFGILVLEEMRKLFQAKEKKQVLLICLSEIPRAKKENLI